MQRWKYFECKEELMGEGRPKSSCIWRRKVKSSFFNHYSSYFPCIVGGWRKRLFQHKLQKAQSATLFPQVELYTTDPFVWLENTCGIIYLGTLCICIGTLYHLCNRTQITIKVNIPQLNHRFHYILQMRVLEDI